MTSFVMPIWIKSIEDTEALNLTEQALESLGEGQRVIVDNGCTVGGGWLKTKADIYLRFPDNRGYTVGINRGIMLADGDLIALCNNDIRVSPYWQDIAREILADPKVGTLHCKMVKYDDPFELGNDVIKEGYERWCHNSFTITTKKFLEKMKSLEPTEPYPGLFDENYGKGGGADDWDFFCRVRKLGFNTCYTNRIAFQHKDGFTYKMMGPERQRIVDENNEYFKKKWGRSKEEVFDEQCPGQLSKNYLEGFI